MRHRNLSSFVRTNTPFANIVKSTDETVVSNTTVQDDNELFVRLRANKVYAFTLLLFCGGTVPDIKYTFEIIPNTITDGFVSDNGESEALIDFGTDEAILLDSDNDVVSIRGKVITGSTKGILQFQFAQNTSNVLALTVFAGSMLTVWEDK